MTPLENRSPPPNKLETRATTAITTFFGSLFLVLFLGWILSVSAFGLKHADEWELARWSANPIQEPKDHYVDYNTAKDTAAVLKNPLLARYVVISYLAMAFLIYSRDKMFFADNAKPTDAEIGIAIGLLPLAPATLLWFIMRHGIVDAFKLTQHALRL